MWDTENTKFVKFAFFGVFLLTETMKRECLSTFSSDCEVEKCVLEDSEKHTLDHFLWSIRIYTHFWAGSVALKLKQWVMHLHNANLDTKQFRHSSWNWECFRLGRMRRPHKRFRLSKLSEYRRFLKIFAIWRVVSLWTALYAKHFSTLRSALPFFQQEAFELFALRKNWKLCQLQCWFLS